MFTQPGQEQDGTAFTRRQRGMAAGADGGRGADFYPYPLGASPRAYDSTTREGRVGYVDQLFAFSEPLGYDYSGAWLGLGLGLGLETLTLTVTLTLT